MTVLAWFMWRRWWFKNWCFPARMSMYHNLNVHGCRKHPVIYNDMCRIVRGMK